MELSAMMYANCTSCHTIHLLSIFIIIYRKCAMGRSLVTTPVPHDCSALLVCNSFITSARGCKSAHVWFRCPPSTARSDLRADHLTQSPHRSAYLHVVVWLVQSNSTITSIYPLPFLFIVHRLTKLHMWYRCADVVNRSRIVVTKSDATLHAIIVLLVVLLRSRLSPVHLHMLGLLVVLYHFWTNSRTEPAFEIECVRTNSS